MKIERGMRCSGLCWGCGHFTNTGILQVVDIRFHNGRGGAEIAWGTLCSDKQCREAAEKKLQAKLGKLRLSPRIRIRSLRDLFGADEIILEEAV